METHIDQNYIRNVYENIFTRDLPVERNDNLQLMYLLQYIPPSKDAAILDAGCGNGRYAALLSDFGYRNIDAIDLFSEIHSDKFRYAQRSIEQTGFGNEAFDFIYSLTVIYYLDRPEEAIREFGRILKPGGVLLVTGHTKYSLFTLKRKIKLLSGWDRNSVVHLQGVRFRDVHYYERALNANGFRILRVDGFKMTERLYGWYCEAASRLQRRFGIRLPDIPDHMARHWLSGRLRSIFAYHFIIVAQKQ